MIVCFEKRGIGTEGTNPQAGIDFEPNRVVECLVDCYISNCLFQNNKGPGILIWLINLNKTSESVDITIDSCVFKRNGWGLGIYLGGLKDSPEGTLTLSNNKLGLINLLPKKSIKIEEKNYE